MATIKSYTSIKQSRKLAEILPLESADMCYLSEGSLFPKVNYNGMVFFNSEEEKPSTIIPCWSLAALLEVLSKSLIYTPNQALDRYCCKNIMHDLETYGKNPIDACYEMILKLNELNLL